MSPKSQNVDFLHKFGEFFKEAIDQNARDFVHGDPVRDDIEHARGCVVDAIGWLEEAVRKMEAEDALRAPGATE